MKLAIVLAVIGITVFAGSMSNAYAAVDMFMKIDGVDGESQKVGHVNEIDVLSWSWGMSQSATVAGAGGGKASVHDFTITKLTDKSTPNLMLDLLSGKHITDATFVIRKSGEKPLEYLQIKMTDVIISSINMGGSSGDDRPTETVTLNFAKFEVQYVPQKPDGTGDAPVKIGWDIAGNRAT